MNDYKYPEEYERLDRYRNQTWKNEDTPENGFHTSYFLNDFNDISQKKCTEEYYKNGKLDGKQTSFNADGSIKEIQIYTNGELFK